MFNWVKTFVLMAAITALFVVAGGATGGQQGMVIALLLAVAMNFFSYWFSDKLVLRMYTREKSMRRARRRSTVWSGTLPRVRNCRCRASI